MKTKILFPVIALVVLGLFLAGCSKDMVPASWPGVTADSERAYVAAGPYVYAVDLNTGNEIWHFPADKSSAANPFDAAPALTPDGSQLIVAGFDKVLYSLDPATGATQWEFRGSTSRYYASPLVANGLIYAASTDYHLYALNFDGELQWDYAAGQALWAMPVSDGARVYFGALDGQVYALDATTGELVWNRDVGNAVLGTPALDLDGTLYTGTLSGAVYALDTATGELRWTQPFQAEGDVWASPALANGNLYIADATGWIYILDPADGQESQLRIETGEVILNGPLFIQDMLVYGTGEGSLCLVNQQGVLQKINVNGQIYGTPAASGDILLVAPYQGDSTLIALTVEGVRRWSFTPGD